MAAAVITTIGLAVLGLATPPMPPSSTVTGPSLLVSVPPVPTSRRDALSAFAALPLAAALALAPASSSAFDNGMPEMAKFKDKPKQKGPKPSDIGLKNRVVNSDGDVLEGAVKTCGQAPNCFTTTGDRGGDVGGDTDHLLDAWQPPQGVDPMAQLKAAVEAYTPGHTGSDGRPVDGGGFKIVSSEPKYLYIQFESLRQGYIDDVEFALGGGAAGATGVQVRSSSRLGYLDFGVNASRLNEISAKLRAQGWKAPEITAKTHPDYFAQNTPRR